MPYERNDKNMDISKLSGCELIGLASILAIYIANRIKSR